MKPILDSSLSALRASLAIGAMALGVAAPAHAIVYDFKSVFGGVNADFTLGDDLHVEVTENLATSANDVLFKFTNQIAEPDAYISNIYFDLGASAGLFSGMVVTETGGTVNLVPRTIDPTPHPFLPTDFYAEYRMGLSQTYPYSQGIYGIHPGEYAVLTGTLGSGYSFADALAALGQGTSLTSPATGLRVGVTVLHTKGDVPGDLSTYYDDVGYITNSVVAVPEAETWAMMLAGLGLVGAMARRHRA